MYLNSYELNYFLEKACNTFSPGFINSKFRIAFPESDSVDSESVETGEAVTPLNLEGSEFSEMEFSAFGRKKFKVSREYSFDQRNDLLRSGPPCLKCNLVAILVVRQYKLPDETTDLETAISNTFRDRGYIYNQFLNYVKKLAE